MKKRLSSQWEFDDLFSNAPSMQDKEKEGEQENENKSSTPSETKEKPVKTRAKEKEPEVASAEADRPLSVSEITARIRGAIERDCFDVQVRGEVTNLRRQSSGHIYFSIKDKASQLQCVLFRGQRNVQRELVDDGQELIVRGGISVYEARGQYQLIVRGVEPVGIGALQAAFEKLKARLQDEGLFASEIKKPLPKFIQTVGIVTSKSGAAIRDVLHVMRRRHSNLDIVIVNSRVQGEGAASEIADGIDRLNHFSSGSRKIDVILVTRGGGSLEDLWAFNEECVARAIHRSGVPVISAVGHEIDFTISDFTADYRAVTPSAAAEVLTEGFVRAREQLSHTVARLTRITQTSVAFHRHQFHNLENRLKKLHPRRDLEQKLLRVDEMSLRLKRQARQSFEAKKRRLQSLVPVFYTYRPSGVFTRLQKQVSDLGKRMKRAVDNHYRTKNQRLVKVKEKLALLSPHATLDRGYAIAFHKDSNKNRSIVRNSMDLTPGDRIEVRLKVGKIDALVEGRHTDNES